MDTPAQFPAPLWLLVALQTGVSAAGLVVEITAARMIAPYVGMSLYTWTAIIAVVLAGFSAGHWWGGRLAVRESGAALAATGWVMLAAAVTTAGASLILRFTAGPVLQSFDNPLAAITVIVTLAFFLPALFSGVPAPVLAVVAMRGRDRSEAALGLMFAAGAAGAIAGTLLAGFVFISWLGSVLTLLVIAASFVLAAGLCLALARVPLRAGLAALLGVAAAMLLGLRALALPAVCDVESSYFCIRTVQYADGPGGPVNLMVLDHLAHGISARDTPEVMQTDHAAMLDALPRMRMGERDFTSFHIGGGTFSVPRAWAARGIGGMTVAEIDPAVTAKAVADFWFDPDTARVLHQDARTVLRNDDGGFDVIIGDAFADIAVPPHLVTREFFELVARRLAPDGVFAMNIIDNIDRLAAFSAMVTTLKLVFPSVEVWTEARPPEPGERRVFVVLAGRSDSPVSAITALTPEPKRFAVLDAGFVQAVIDRTRPPVLTDDFAPIDRLLGIEALID